MDPSAKRGPASKRPMRRTLTPANKRWRWRKREREISLKGNHTITLLRLQTRETTGYFQPLSVSTHSLLSAMGGCVRMWMRVLSSRLASHTTAVLQSSKPSSVKHWKGRGIQLLYANSASFLIMARAFIKWISQSGQIIIKNFALMFNNVHSEKDINGTKINEGSQARHIIKKRWMTNLEKKCV